MAAYLRTLTLQSLEALGGAQEIVRTHLDGALRNFSREERYAVADLFHQLVTPSGTKIAHSAEDLAEYVALPVASVAVLLEKLAAPDTRIVRAVAPPPGDPGPSRYEIFHDVLAPSILDWRSRQSASRRARAVFRRRVLRLFAVLGAAVIALIVWLAIAAVNARNRADVSAARARSAQLRAESVSQQNALLATNFKTQSRQNASLAKKNGRLAATYNHQRLVARSLKRRADNSAAAARVLAARASQLAAINGAQAATQRSLATRARHLATRARRLATRARHSERAAQRSASAALLSLTISKESAALASVSPSIDVCIGPQFPPSSHLKGRAGFDQIEIGHVPPHAIVTADLPGDTNAAGHPARQTITNGGKIGTAAFTMLAQGCGGALPLPLPPQTVLVNVGQKLVTVVKLRDLAWRFEGRIDRFSTHQQGLLVYLARFQVLKQQTCRTPGSRAKASEVPRVCPPLP